jgi:UDP-galactopyranose mutase
MQKCTHHLSKCVQHLDINSKFNKTWLDTWGSITENGCNNAVCSGSMDKFYSYCNTDNARNLTCHLFCTQISKHKNHMTSFSNTLFNDAILKKSFNGLNIDCRPPTGSLT